MISPEADETTTVSWVNSQLKTARSARMAVERQWYTNIAFFFGKQWITWQSSGNFSMARMVEPAAPPWRVRLTVNKIRQYIRAELARMNSSPPRGFIMPASSDSEDQARARSAQIILDHLVDSSDLDLKQEIADLWAILCGTSFLKVFYDSGAVDNTVNPTTLGKINTVALSPFHVLVPNLDVPLLSDQPWVCHSAILPLSNLQAAYGEAAIGLKEEEHSADNLEERLFNAMQITDKKATSQGIEVKELWLTPSVEWPEGGLIVVAQERLLYRGPNPYEHGMLPIIKREHTLTNRFYASTFVDDMIQLQKEYNRSRSQVIESKNRMTRPQWIAEMGSVDVKAMTSEPGAVIQHRPGSRPPGVVQMASLPGYVFENMSAIREEMDDTASQHPVSRGDVPPNVEAATAISYLQERDDGPISYAIRSKERSYQWIGRQFLGLAIQFWDAQRTVTVVGKNNNFESYLLSGSDIKGATDYHVVKGSAQPVSRAARKAELLELGKMGIVPQHKLLQYLEFPELGKLYEELQADARQAQRQNLMMSKGEYADVEPWHDHLAHIAEHNEFRKMEEYENLPDPIKNLFRVHVYYHMRFVTMIFGLQTLIPENPEQAAMNGGVDPAYEVELTKAVSLLQASGGMPPPQPQQPPM